MLGLYKIYYIRIGTTRLHEKTRSTTSEPEECSQQRPEKMGFTWEEAEVAALDRHGWRRSVAQCVQLDAGWTSE